MSGSKYRSDKGGKGEKYMSSYRENEGSSKPSYSAAYDDHYNSHSQPPKVGSVKVAREQQQHRSPHHQSLYELKKSHKNKGDYSREFKDSASKKLKSKEDYYYYRDERDVYKDEYYDDSHKAESSTASSKKYFVDDGFKGNQRLYHSERAHKEMPFKDPYKSKGDLSYDEPYKSHKSYDPYDAPPTKSYKEYHREKKYSVSPPRKISRRSYSFSPPPNKQAPAYDNYREAEFPKPHHGDFRGRGRSMNKPRGDYREANDPIKPMESDVRGSHMSKMRMQDFRGGAPGTKGRGINGGNVGRFDNYTAPPLPTIEQRGRPYDSFSNSYEEQRDDPYYRPQPPLPTKEKKYAQYNEVERLPKSVDPPAQLSRYVIGDSVVYGSPGHYPHGLVSPRRYSASPPRRSKYPPKEVSMSPPGLDAAGSFRQQTPSLSPHYPLYDEPMRRTPPARESKRKRSHSPLRPTTKRTESASNKRPPSPLPPRNTRNSFSPSFKHSRNAGAPQSASHTEGPASDRQWSGGKTSGGPSRSGGAKQSQSGSLGRRNVSSPTRKDPPPPKDGSTSDKGSGKSRSSSRRSQSPNDHRNKNQHSKHADDRSSPSSKKPLLNNPPTLPVNSEQGLLGAKPLLLCTPPLLSLPAPPLMGVRPAMPMLPPILGRPGGLLDGRLGLVGGGFKRLPGDAVRGGRLGGRGRGNMRRPMDLRGLIESRKERHQPPMGRFVPPGHRHGDGPVHDARRQPPDGEGRRGWHQDNRMNPPRPVERFPHNDGRPQQAVPRVRDRLLNRAVRPLVARKPLVSRVPRITNRKLLPASRPLGAAGMQGPGAPRPRPAGPAAGGQVRSNRSPTGGRSGVRGVPARVPARPKLSALVNNRTAVLKKYQRLTGRARAGASEGGARRAMAAGRGAGAQATRKKPLQQQERDNPRRGDDKTHRKQESDDHRRDEGAPWRRESGGGRRGDDSRGGREARDRRDNLPGAGRARRGSSHVRDGKKKSAASSPRKLEKSQCNVRGTIDRSPKVSSTTGSSNNSNNKNKRRLSRSPSSSSSADSYKRHRANSASRRDSSGSRYSRSPRHNKFSRSSPPYPAKNSSASSHRRSKYSPSPKPNSKYSSKSSRPAMRHSRSRSRSSSGSMSSISRGRKSASPSLSP